MRLVFRTIILFLAVSLAVPCSTLAGTSDREKLAKLVRKVAIPGSTVFTPEFKPKVLCHCRTDPQRRAGFLWTNDGTIIGCAVPISLTPEGMFSVVDYGCPDFEVVRK